MLLFRSVASPFIHRNDLCHRDDKWRVLHAVEEIIPNSCPAHLPQELVGFRASLQLRGLPANLKQG